MGAKINKSGILILISLISSFFIVLPSCTETTGAKSGKKDIFSMDNLVAWCVVPFDAKKRGPEERAKMLDGLGFKRMAWDWRMEHLETLPDEIEALRKYDIELTGVWISLGSDSRNELLPSNHQIFDAIADAGVTTTYWVAVGDDFFTGTSDEERISEGARAIGMVHERARETDSRVALYNHMGWSGEPENQVRIIEKYGSDDVGIVYNFHHAHHRVDDFKQLLDIMMPYLYTVNLNGMRIDGTKIMDIGSGDLESSMIKTLLESDFEGTVGILDHVGSEDAEVVLRRNLEGLEKILNDI